MIVIQIDPGEEVVSKTSTEVNKFGVENGAIVSIIGAVESCKLSNMDAKDSSKDYFNTYDEQLELSGNGEIKDGEVHIHAVVSRKGEEAMAGHLHEAVVGDWFVRLYVEPLGS